MTRPKVLLETSGFNMPDNSASQGADSNNESLGLIPSHLLSGKQGMALPAPGIEGSMLPLGSLCSSGPVLADSRADQDIQSVEGASCSRENVVSSCSRENVVSGAGSSTSDSSNVLTVLKCSQMKSAEGRLVPQTLFRSLSPVPAQIEEEVEDKQVEDEALHSLQGDNFAGVLSRVRLPATGGVKNVPVTAPEEEEADQTIHQVALEAEDLEELEEVCCDLEDGSSSEEEPDRVKDVADHQGLSSGDQCPSDSIHFPSILYKRSENISYQPHSTQLGTFDSKGESAVDTSESQYGASLVFGPSLQLEERHSKDFGFNPFSGELASFNSEVFGEEEFNFKMDEDGARAFLEQDEEAFNKENLLNNQELSLMSMRGTEDTFHNMTIGTYMKACSEPLGSLGSAATERVSM
ncbi:hypothetical protein ElyMa_003016500 [Elysia marginata]|uniref:Uncharacterized protein n=1 Tax=Elysia marginata TaxID=1093978 RepID=A0AAV4IJJ4_9GAST|nr:hypothetical protein ElyMa_003016500 [Elysia marginata]